MNNILLFLFWASLSLPLPGVTRFWVGGGSSTAFNATANTNWSASSGGANNASVPTTGDTAIWDGNSGAGPSVVTANTGNVLVATFTGGTGNYTGNFTINTGVHMGFTSSLTMAPAMTTTCNGTGFVDFLGSGAGTITTNGTNMCGLTNGGTGTLTLQDNFTSASSSNITITAGQIQFNAKTVSTAELVSSGATARTLDMTNMILNLPNTGTVLSFTGSNLTLTPTGSTINITNTSSSAKVFTGGGTTFAVLTITGGAGSGAVTFQGANTFTTFTVGAGSTVIFPSSTTTTVTSLVLTAATINNIITLKSNSTGTKATISQASGTISALYIFIRDIAFTGGATFNCTWCNNFSDNTGISFLSPTQVGAFLVGL